MKCGTECGVASICSNGSPIKSTDYKRRVAEGVGFEPTLRFPVNTLSKRAPSATRPPLLSSRNGARLLTARRARARFLLHQDARGALMRLQPHPPHCQPIDTSCRRDAAFFKPSSGFRLFCTDMFIFHRLTDYGTKAQNTNKQNAAIFRPSAGAQQLGTRNDGRWIRTPYGAHRRSGAVRYRMAVAGSQHQRGAAGGADRRAGRGVSRAHAISRPRGRNRFPQCADGFAAGGGRTCGVPGAVALGTARVVGPAVHAAGHGDRANHSGRSDNRRARRGRPSKTCGPSTATSWPR